MGGRTKRKEKIEKQKQEKAIIETIIKENSSTPKNTYDIQSYTYTRYSSGYNLSSNI